MTHRSLAALALVAAGLLGAGCEDRSSPTPPSNTSQDAPGATPSSTTPRTPSPAMPPAPRTPDSTGVTPAPSAPAMPPTTAPSGSSGMPDRDNTGLNTRDRASSAGDKTADAAGQGRSDVQLAAEIRSRITSAELSVNARNAKVVVQRGRVTLRGPVANAQEKQTLGQIAAAVVGEANVDNQLEVEANP